MRYCDCLLHHHLGRGNTQHLLVGIQAPGSGHRQLARQVGEVCVTFSLFLPFDLQDKPNGEQIQPIPYGCFGSAPSGIRDLVRESQVQSDRQRLPHAAPLTQTQPHHPDFTSPAQRALGSAFATSTRGAASCGTPQLPRVGRGWHVATRHHDRRGRCLVITCFGFICAGTVFCSGTSASQGGVRLRRRPSPSGCATLPPANRPKMMTRQILMLDEVSDG